MHAKRTGDRSSDSPRVQSIGSLVSQLISRRGYAQTAANDQIHDLITQIVGEDLASHLSVGKVNRGVLKIHATDSVLVQELTFQKPAILKKLRSEMPQAKITDLRFAIQPR